MPDPDAEEFVVLDPQLEAEDPPKRRGKKREFDIDRAMSLIRRVTQRRAKIVDRYHGMSLLRDSTSWDGKVMPSDPPAIQALFYARERMCDALVEIRDPTKKHLAVQGYLKLILQGCERIEDQNTRIEAVIQEQIKRAEEAGTTPIDPAEVYRLGTQRAG